MKKLLLASIAAAGFCGAPALAADMPVKAPLVAAAPYDPWSGCYVGGNGGYLWGDMKHLLRDDAGPVVPPLSTGSTNAKGWAGGGQIGCDYRFNNNWIVGIRGMWDGADVTGSNHWPAPLNTAVANNHKISEFATVVATLGVLLNPNLELYGFGGVAWVRDRLVITEAPIFNPPELWTGRQGRTGYDVGVGAAWIFAPHWNLFVEYDHMGFGTKNFRLTGINAAAGLTFSEDIKLNVDKILLGLNYRFGGPR